MLWRLGEVLFDGKENVELGPGVSHDVKQQVRGLQFKTSISNWLQSAVAPNVEADIRSLTDTSNAAKAFTMLTGHQIRAAAEASATAGDLTLSMIIAQAGGDIPYKAGLAQQLDVWKKQGVDAMVSPAYRDVYSLLAGILRPPLGPSNSVPGRAVSLTNGLDWKRAFGIFLWYGTALDAPVLDAMERFAVEHQGSEPKAKPWYSEDAVAASRLSWLPRSRSLPPDAIFSLMRLRMDGKASLEPALEPRGFSPSPFDHRLPWHLYVLLFTVFQTRDFSDRVDFGAMEVDGESSHRLSVRAEKLALDYAAQLEYLGQLEEAVFVLLHLRTRAGYVDADCVVDMHSSDLFKSRARHQRLIVEKC